MSDYVLCVRNEKNGEFGTETGDVSYLEIRNTETVPTPLCHKVESVKIWLENIMDKATKNGNTELNIVFFVHGYNTDSQEALERQRLLEKNLCERGLSCIVIGFDWASDSSPILYKHDRTNASHAAYLLVDAGIVPFALFNRPNCTIKIHIVAHSMGAFVIREAFRQADDRRMKNVPNDWRVNQLVLFAADLSSSSFAVGEDSKMLPIFNHCGRLTNYFSGYDSALCVSDWKNVDVSSRVGRVGMPADTPGHSKALDVDCGFRYNAIPPEELESIKGMISHSWYFEDKVWYDDLALTLKGQVDRNQFNTRIKKGENDFELISKKIT